MMNLAPLPILTAASLLWTAAPAAGYPVYKFGLFQGDANTPDACGAGGRRNKCFVWDLETYPDCYEFSATESYSGAIFDSTSLTYDLHPKCTDCSCSTGSGRKGTTLGTCEFFSFGGVYWLKLECVLEKDGDECPDDYVECTDCLTGCSAEATAGNSDGEGTTDGGEESTSGDGEDVAGEDTAGGGEESASGVVTAKAPWALVGIFCSMLSSY